MLRILPRRPMLRRRLTTILATLATTVAATMAGLSVGAAPAHAAGGYICNYGAPPGYGWVLVREYSGPGAKVQIYQSDGYHYMMVRFANTLANGKYNVFGQAGISAQNPQNLGTTTYIGVAPYGGWCSDVHHEAGINTARGRLDWWVGTSYYYRIVDCVEGFCNLSP